MAKVEFIPNDPAPSDAEKTVYNVIIGGVFIGYICKTEWLDVWRYFVGGECVSDGYTDRCDLFNLIQETLMFGRR